MRKFLIFAAKLLFSLLSTPSYRSLLLHLFAPSRWERPPPGGSLCAAVQGKDFPGPGKKFPEIPYRGTPFVKANFLVSHAGRRSTGYAPNYNSVVIFSHGRRIAWNYCLYCVSIVPE